MRAVRQTLILFAVLVGILGVLAFAPAAHANNSPGIGATEGTPLYSSNMPFQLNLLSPSTASPEGTLFACSLPERPKRGQSPPPGYNKAAADRAVSLGVAGQAISQDEMHSLQRVFDSQRAILESDLKKDEKAAVLRVIEGGQKAGGNTYNKLVLNGSLMGLSKDQIKKLYGADGEIAELMKNKRLRAMVNPAPKNIAELRKFVPASCVILSNDAEIEMPGIGHLIKSPGDFTVRLGLFAASTPFELLYEAAAPIAYRYSFFTPHSERGESMFNMPEQDGEAARLGFDKALANNPEAQMERGGWLGVAVWMRAFISGFYILLIIVAAFFYMMRGSVKGKMNVLKMMPLVLLSALAMAAVPVLIGYGITASNLVVTEIFSMPDTCTNAAGKSAECMPALERVNMMVNSAPALDSDSLKTYTFKVASLASTSIFLLVMAVIALLRQIALIVLVVVSPIACFAIINDRWHVHVMAWLKITAGVIFLPVLMAVVLKIGLMLNPLTGKMVPGWVPSDEGMGFLFLGLLIMLATFYFMVKIPTMLAKSLLRGTGSPGGRSMNMLQRAAMRSTPLGAAASTLGSFASRNRSERGSLTTRLGGAGTPVAGMGAGRRSLGAGIGAPVAGQAAGAAGALTAVAGQAAGAADPNTAAPGAAQQAAAAAGAAGAAATAAGTAGATAAGAVAGAAGTPAAGAATGAAAGAGAPGATGATGAVSATGANITAAAVTAGTAHVTDTGTRQRQEITRAEYEDALGVQRSQVQAAAETGDPVQPTEWLPVQEDGNYYLEHNASYAEEMAAIGQSVEGAATEPVVMETAPMEMVATGAGGRHMEHATAAAAAAVAASGSDSAEADTIHGSAAPIMGRSSATLEADGGGGSGDSFTDAGHGPGPAQTAFSADTDLPDGDDLAPAGPSMATPNVSIPDIADEDAAVSWAPPQMPAGDADLDALFEAQPLSLDATGPLVANEGAAVVSSGDADVPAPTLGVPEMVLPEGALTPDLGDIGSQVADQVGGGVGDILRAEHERTADLVSAVDRASERISEATAAHGASLAASGARAAHQFQEATSAAAEETGSQLEKVRHSSDELRETMAGVLDEYRTSSAAMAEGTRVFSERAEEVSHLMQGTNNAMFDQLGRVSEAMGSRYEEINERIERLSVGLSDMRNEDMPTVINELGRSRKELDQMLGAVDGRLSEHRSTVRSLVPRIGNQVDAAMDDMSDQLRRGRDTIDELTRRISQLTD